MKTSYKSTGIYWLFCVCAAALMLGGCGGGGGGGGVDDSGSGVSSGSGNVAILLADGPADDYNEIWISVTRVLLIPAAKNPNRPPVVIYESDAGHEVNLLELRDEDFLLTVKKRVPAGWYSKIRLEVKDVWAEGGPCDTFKLPSDRIDLNPRGDFRVKSGETLSIRLDIDADKSINLHEAGKSGKCIFRPVVFVDIDTIIAPRRCPRILVGEIERLLPDEKNIAGFTLDLFGKRGTIDVWLSDYPDKLTAIFGEDGFRVRKSALEPGQKVQVTGKITSKGDLTASVIIVGDVTNVKGTVASSVNNSIFTLLLDPGQIFVDDLIKVEVPDPPPLVLLGCDEEVSTAAIQRGKRARVVGKPVLSEGVLRAIAVFLKSDELIGDLVGIERATGGTNLLIEQDDGGPITVFLPQDTPIYLQGDGPISLRLLNQIVTHCGSKRVRVDLDPDEIEPTAREVRVQAERLYGQVVYIDYSSRVVELSGGKIVSVQEGATILLNTNRADIPVRIDELRVGDILTLYGLTDCEILDPEPQKPEFDFYAYIVLIDNQTEPPPPSEDQCKRNLKPLLLEMQYTGQDCAASNNDQDPKKTQCLGDPNFESEVFIRASDKETPDDSKANVWFEGLVDRNDTFYIDAANAGEDQLKSNTWVHIYGSRGGRLLQKVNFHTSCSQPLAVGDQFGSLVLEDIELISK